jgi:septal ring factor EnvC (AmiA/AmiB activator)
MSPPRVKSELSDVDKWVNEVQEMRKEHEKEVADLRRALADAEDKQKFLHGERLEWMKKAEALREQGERLREAEELLQKMIDPAKDGLSFIAEIHGYFADRGAPGR